MKLNEHMDGYNIKDLSKIASTVGTMKNDCDILEQAGNFLVAKVNKARADGFTSINCDKVEENVNEYLKKLEKAKAELYELSDSLKKFTDKIEDIWSSWRN